MGMVISSMYREVLVLTMLAGNGDGCDIFYWLRYYSPKGNSVVENIQYHALCREI